MNKNSGKPKSVFGHFLDQTLIINKQERRGQPKSVLCYFISEVLIKHEQEQKGEAGAGRLYPAGM